MERKTGRKGAKMKVSANMLLKTHIEKMTVSCLATMLLKNQIVISCLPRSI